MNEKEEYLTNIYYNPKHPASYGSVNTLLKYAKRRFETIKLDEVRKWLSEQLAYTLHRPARKFFLRNKIYVSHVNEQFQADLVDMQEYSSQNAGYKYLLTVIDCLSKYLWVFPLKSKNPTNIVNAFKEIFKERKCLKLQTDRGTEFNNQQFKSFCERENVKFFTSQDVKIKCSIVERVNRTLKDKMFRYFTANGTRKYINVYKDLVHSYNTRVHRSIKMRPVDVDESNERLAFKNLYGVRSLKELIQKKQRNHFEVGDTVRRKYDLSHFDRSYYPNWSDQSYKVSEALKKLGKNQYIIRDFRGNKLKRRFYKEELQSISDNTAYRIEKVIKRRRRNNSLEYLVKWVGYPSSENSWIPAEDLINLNRRR
jgi:hypothetical protein